MNRRRLRFVRGLVSFCALGAFGACGVEPEPGVSQVEHPLLYCYDPGCDCMVPDYTRPPGPFCCFISNPKYRDPDCPNNPPPPPPPPPVGCCPNPGDYRNGTNVPFKWMEIAASTLSPSTCGPGGAGVGTSICAPIVVYMPDPDLDPAYLKHELFVLLPGSGERTTDFDQILRTAAYAGYYAIGLSYANVPEVAGVCGSSPRNRCASPPDDYADECTYSVRMERIAGVDSNFTVPVMVSEDSIVTRLIYTIRLLYQRDLDGYGLDDVGDDYGFNDWCGTGRAWINDEDITDAVPGSGQLFDLDDVGWPGIVLAGFSQGSGHAALISLREQVSGLVLLDGPNDRCCPAGTCPTYNDTVESSYYHDIPNASASAGKFAAMHTGANLEVPAAPYDDLGFNLQVQDWDATITAAGAGTPELGPSTQIIQTAQVRVPGYTEHQSMAFDGAMPTNASSGTAALETQPYDMHLWEAYLEGFCRVVE